ARPPILSSGRPVDSGRAETLLAQHRASRLRSEEAYECLGRLALGRLRERGSAVNDRLLQFGRQRIEYLDARNRQELAQLLHADIGLAPRHYGADELPRARCDPLCRHCIGDTEPLEHLAEMHAARPGAVRYRTRREERTLQLLRRADVRPWRARPHCEPGGGTGKSGAAAREQLALGYERIGKLLRPDEEVAARAIAYPVGETRSTRIGN